MDLTGLIPDLKLHGRIDTDSEDAGLLLMLKAAAADVAHAAGYTLPDLVADLPDDMRFAIVDQAARTYDLRGADEGKAGLSLAASRIVSRYRGVSLGVEDATVV